MKFYSRKDPLFFIIIYGLVVFLGYEMYSKSLIYTSYDAVDFWVLSWVVVIVFFMLSMLHGTRYRLNNEKLFFRCGPFFGSIKIKSITEIIVGKTLWVGMRPATARNGLIVKYKGGLWGEIYISPKTNEAFVEEILKHNSNIKITR